MNQFYFAHIEDKPELYIIRAAFPAIVARVIMFASVDKMESYIASKWANTGECVRAQVEGYSILIVPHSNGLPTYGEFFKQPAFLYQQMASHFLTYKINQHPRQYRRSKIK